MTTLVVKRQGQTNDEIDEDVLRELVRLKFRDRAKIETNLGARMIRLNKAEVKASIGRLITKGDLEEKT